MRVGIILNQDIPTLGGSHTFASNIMQALLQFAPHSSHEFVVFGRSSEAPTILRNHICITYVSIEAANQEPLGHKVLRTLSQLIHLIRHPSSQIRTKSWYEKTVLSILQAQSIDIIWQLSPRDTLTLEIPFITTVWDLAHRVHPYFPEVSVTGWKWDAREHLYMRTLLRASFVLTGTEAGKAEIERFYQVPSERIKVIPFPVPEFALEVTSQSEDNSIFEKYNLSENYLFYPAQFWSHKNHINLLLALKFLRDHEKLSLPLVFSGSDQGNQKLVESFVAEHGLAGQVRFLGFVPKVDLIQLYRHALALVYVTFFGPDNLPPLEAFALGCPVIASKVSGAEEQLGNAALLIDPKDPMHIASAIKTLWNSPEIRQLLIDQGYQRAKQWSNQDYVKAVFSILDEFEKIRRCWRSSMFE